MSRYSKTTLFYSFMRVYSNFIYKRWFSSIEINGDMNIPEGEPVIFAPNHQNAFIDAMALLSSSPQPVVFWVRADLFNNKIIGGILRALKMMPAYRLRNGFGNLKKNEESINNSDDVLTHNQFLCLMPEGGQDEKRVLRPLVKGIFRSAFSAQEKLGDSQWVKIVPTGFDYGHYDKSGRHLIVNFGKPINIKDYKAMYDENAPVALNTIKDDLANRMEALMLNIKSKEHYDTFYTASYLYNYAMLQMMELPENETNRLVARKEIIKHLELAESNEEMSDLIQALDTECKKWNDKHDDPAYAARVHEDQGIDADLIIKIFYLIITIPLWIYSALVNGLVYIVCKLLGKKTGGSGFEASVKFGAAGILFPILYIIETIIFAATYSPDKITTLAFAVSLPFSFFFFLRYKWKFQYVKERLKDFFKKPEEPSKVTSLMQQIISLTKNKLQ